MTAAAPVGVDSAVAGLVGFLETGIVPEGLFAQEVFADVSLPRWRLQGATREELIAIRQAGHPTPGQVRVERLESTEHGFVMQFEERWRRNGQDWYSREAIRADVVDDQIVDIAVYCTGDWDAERQRQHAQNVGLLRP